MTNHQPADPWLPGPSVPSASPKFRRLPPFGEKVVSWEAVEDDLYPGKFLDEGPTQGDVDQMQRLRGLVVVQAAETEAVLAEALRTLGLPTKTRKGNLLPASVMLKDLQDALATIDEAASLLESVRLALEPRNRAVHDRARFHYTWVPYLTGGGHHEAAVSTLGGEIYDEHDLRHDLALQQAATVAAVRLLREVIQQRDSRAVDFGP